MGDPLSPAALVLERPAGVDGATPPDELKAEGIAPGGRGPQCIYSSPASALRWRRQTDRLQAKALEGRLSVERKDVDPLAALGGVVGYLKSLARAHDEWSGKSWMGEGL